MTEEFIKTEDERQRDNLLKIKIFFERKIPVHLLKKDREWMNGYIQELGSNFFTIDEFKFGRRIVFLHELFSIEELVQEDVK